MKVHKMIALLTLIVMILLVLSACQPEVIEKEVIVTKEVEKEVVVTEEVIVTEIVEVEPEEESTFERAKREGVIRVAFANEAPYAYVSEEGKLTGESVEVARAIFKNLGIEEMDGILTEWSGLIPGLIAKRYDAITAGMFIYPKRCEQVLFSDPDYALKDALIVKAGNPFDLYSMEDIAANPDVRVGTGAGYSSVDWLKGVGVTDDQIQLYPDGPSGVAALKADQIDVWTSTAPACTVLVENADDPDLELVAEDFEPPIIDGTKIINYGGVAFRYEDQDLRNAYNEELAKLKESGELLEIHSQFPGFGASTQPGAVYAEDLCPDEYADIE
ncbi:MAG: ectoine/hydroxyectoine ABC transporter substrate-binding protein EhuB [Anaerolineales bacterium]